MAKDDYYVIVQKILDYLYMQLKNGENSNPDFIKNDGFLFKINERYWTYIIVHMLKDGYIEGVTVTNLSDDSHLNEIIYNNALEIIRKTKNSDTEMSIVFNKKINLIKKQEKRYIICFIFRKKLNIIKKSKIKFGIHNHPTNLPPS